MEKFIKSDMNYLLGIVTLFCLFLLLFLIFIILTILFPLVSSFFSKEAPFVPTSMKVVREMLKIASLKEGERVYDLGCGDGRIVIEAARHYKVKAIGVEKFFGTWLLAKLRNFFYGGKAIILRDDFRRINLSSAQTIFCYLLPEIMADLEKKIKKECFPGTKIISHDFKIKDWQPEKIKKVGHSTIYLYRV